MNVPPIMVVPVVNALQIQLFKYHDNRDLVLHIRQLTKVYVIIGKDIDNHKLQYFPNSLKEKATNWFGRYETPHPTRHGQRYNLPS
jgi:hypothetical protein